LRVTSIRDVATCNRADELACTVEHASAPETPPIVVVDNALREGTRAMDAACFPAYPVVGRAAVQAPGPGA
jgi:hypothetical protein